MAVEDGPFELGEVSFHHTRGLHTAGLGAAGRGLRTSGPSAASFSAF